VAAWAAAVAEGSSGRWRWRWTWDGDVRVKVTYHAAGGKSVSDTTALMDVWRLHDAGLTIDELRAPSACLTYIAAALFGSLADRDPRIGYVIDSTGYAAATASKHPVGDSTLGDLVTGAVTKQMHSGDRRRAKRTMANSATVDDVFHSAFAEYVLEDVAQNRIGASALPVEWALWEGQPSAENLPFATSPPIASAGPSKRFAMGVSISRELSLDEFGTGKPDDRASNVHSVSLEEHNRDAGWGDTRTGGADRSREDGMQQFERAGRVDPTAEAVLRRYWGQHLLSDREREAVVRVHLMGLTHREAALEMGVATSTVSNLLSRARKKISFDA
jgi:DNA-binding CsgD family transcriptional regulator